MVQAKVLTGEVIAKLDPSGMYEAVLSSPTSFERHLSPLTFSMPPFQRLVVAGMGGSAIAGDVFGAVLEQLGAPVETVVRRSHSIPPWVGEETAIIASSYSGNTKETLAVVHSALERGLTAIALTSGGKLMEVAQENGLPLLKLPPGLQPRAAFPNAIGVLLSLAASAYDLPSLFSWCSQTADELKMLGEKLSFDAPNNPAMEIANHLGDAMPVFYGGGCLSPVARRAAAQFNENGKRLSFHGEFPEMEHNDIVGWACGPCNMKPIIIRSLDDPKMDIVQDSVRKYAEPYVLNAPGSNPLSRIMGSIFILDMASVYVALLSGNDPTPVEAIMDLKASCQHLGPGP